MIQDSDSLVLAEVGKHNSQDQLPEICETLAIDVKLATPDLILLLIVCFQQKQQFEKEEKN